MISATMSARDFGFLANVAGIGPSRRIRPLRNPPLQTAFRAHHRLGEVRSERGHD
jgi:hypothetical protein